MSNDQTSAELDERLEGMLEDELARQFPSTLGDGYIDGDLEALMTAIAPALAEIRRQAAADALRGQAAILRKKRTEHLANAAAPQFAGTPMAQTYRDLALQAGFDARTLRRAADDVIAEGWTETCAKSWPATREDPPEGCETPVPNEGDYCDKHDGGDDE